MANLSQGEQLRFYMSDRPHLSTETYMGDGTASAFIVSGQPLITGSPNLGGTNPTVFIRNANADAWTATSLAATGILFGQMTFAQPIPLGVPFQVSYTYAAFSDQEIDYIVSAKNNDLPGQQMELINVLMGDSYKRARWMAHGVSYDDAQTLQNLIRVRDELWRAMTVELGPLGGIQSWSDNQQNYP